MNGSCGAAVAVAGAAAGCDAGCVLAGWVPRILDMIEPKTLMGGSLASTLRWNNWSVTTSAQAVVAAENAPLKSNLFVTRP